MNPRRRFIALTPWWALGSTAALLAACSERTPAPAPVPPPAPAPAPVDTAAPAASAAPLAAVSAGEPQAAALGYLPLARDADAAKFPKRTAEQQCAGCALYSGAAGSAAGPCSIFGGREVAAAGWCSAWVKKA